MVFCTKFPCLLVVLLSLFRFLQFCFQIESRLILPMKRLLEEKFKKSRTKRTKKLFASFTDVLVKETDQINFKLLLNSPTSTRTRSVTDPSSPVFAASIASTSKLVCTTLLYSALTFNPQKNSPPTPRNSFCTSVPSGNSSSISSDVSSKFSPVSDLQLNCTSEPRPATFCRLGSNEKSDFHPKSHYYVENYHTIEHPITSDLPHKSKETIKRTASKTKRPSSCCLFENKSNKKTSVTVRPVIDKVTVTVSVEVEMQEGVKSDLYVNVKEKLRPVSCEPDLMRDVNWSDIDRRKL